MRMLERFMDFKQNKMSVMEKSQSLYRSVIFPANHVVTIKCFFFLNERCTTRKPVILLCYIHVYLTRTLAM